LFSGIYADRWNCLFAKDACGSISRRHFSDCFSLCLVSWGSAKNNNDTRTNLGLGYDLLGLPLMALSIELEYQKGLNVSPTAGADSKVTALGLNLVFKVGF
jgi:hypothetical protein